MGAALQQVKSKLSTSLAAPERPLFDLGVGLNAEFDTAELSLVVRGAGVWTVECVTGRRFLTSLLSHLPLHWCDGDALSLLYIPSKGKRVTV